MKRVKFFLLCFFLLGTASEGVTEYVMRVNCGGPNYSDTRGRQWLADDESHWDRVGGWKYVYSNAVANTNDDPLYQKSFYALDWYHFPVANGQYQVTLKFAEPFYSNPNKRIFDIRIEGNKVINHLDPPAVYGKGYAFDKTFITNVTDGKLSIQFIHIPRPEGGTYAHAFINAIEILEIGASPATLELNKNKISISVSSKFATFTITNRGDAPLNWAIAEFPDVPWISRITPVNGTTMKDQSDKILVYVNRAGLTTGDY
ncbi:hypothetical protein KAH55_05815, partial [bacterium]|nr:hypothetical protein [bacterium]